MSKPLIVSIPHTGTRFLRDRLEIPEFVHTQYVYWDQLLDQTEGRELISPLRDPHTVWRSFARRWVTRDKPIDTGSFVRSWYVMHALTLVREVDFIAVDLQKDPRITDWNPVGHDDAGEARHSDIVLSHIYQLPFVREFYRQGG